MGFLILVPQGRTHWYDRFTGWVDVSLNEEGVGQAEECAKKISHIKIDVAFTSKLQRAQQTLQIIMQKQESVPIFYHPKGKMLRWSGHVKDDDGEVIVYSDEALNERYYGKLQGMDKQKSSEKYGSEQVHIWRRSYDIRPPGGESLKDTYKRAVPYFRSRIMPHLKKGENVLVSAHGNSLRAIVKFLENISDRNIPGLELPTGEPIVYKLSRGKLKRTKDF